MRINSLVRNKVSQVQKIISNELGIVSEDKYLINVKGGCGGAGISRYDGIGGRGGNVYFVPKPFLAFSDIRKQLNNRMRIHAENGNAARKSVLNGSSGKNTPDRILGSRDM
ncbi:unnamed protein product [Caenorhabditis sp. 36 PRJEB53466]|nr:unnamed protein product [Caenorhabditis sp. 36 PRJEB53466]